ncbi:MAG: hypothetical protein ACE5LB_11150 [Acidiferrobacterales bacterium]
MNALTPTLTRACEFAAAVIAEELKTRQCLNPSFNADEVWASVTHDATIRVGTPLLHPGQGYYVNHDGQHWEV